MLSPTTGWALAGGMVLRTADGGLQWADVTPPGAVLASGITFGGGLTDPSAGAAALSGEDAWVVGGGGAAPEVLYRTTDGGAFWSAAALPAAGYVGPPWLAFLNPDTGWTLALTGVAAGSQGVALYRTDDGGAAWSPVNASDVDGQIPGALPFAGDKTGLGAAPVPTCAPAGAAPCPAAEPAQWLGAISGIRGGEAALGARTDGGVRWGTQDVPLPPGRASGTPLTFPPIFFSSAAGVMAGELVARTTALLLFRTDDGGATWQASAPAVPAGTAGMQVTAAFSGAARGWAVLQTALDGAHTHLYRTVDGGNRWTQVAPDPVVSAALASGDRIVGLDVVSAGTGWMVLASPGGGELLETADGGATWQSEPVAIRTG